MPASAPSPRTNAGTAVRPLPRSPDAYGLGQLCGDLADLLDVLEIDRAIFVGHDWGGFVAWAMPALHPDRVAGVVGVCTPYTPFPGTDFLRRMFDDDDKMYMLWFQQPEVPESVMDPRATDALREVDGRWRGSGGARWSSRWAARVEWTSTRSVASRSWSRWATRSRRPKRWTTT